MDEDKKEELQEEVVKEVEVIKDVSQENNNPPEKKGLSITAMVLGIVAIVLVLVWYISIPCAILAIVFGVVASKKNQKNGMSIAGIILGIVSASIATLIIIFVACFAAIGLTTYQKNSSRIDRIRTDNQYYYNYDY